MRFENWDNKTWLSSRFRLIHLILFYLKKRNLTKTHKY